MKKVALVLIFFSPLMLANWGGFCFSDMRFLGEMDLMSVAIQNQIKEDREFVPKKIVNVENFIREFPQCCRIMPSNTAIPDMFLRLIGFRAYEVEISYPIISGGHKFISLAQYAMDCCGKIALRTAVHY